MTKAREMGRSYMKAAGAASAAIAEHNRKGVQLFGASALRSFEYLTGLARAKTGLEAIEASGAHCRNQLNALGDCHGQPRRSCPEDAKHLPRTFRARGGVARHAA